MKARTSFLVLSLTALGCSREDTRPVYPHFDQSILDLAKADAQLSTFVRLVGVAGLDGLLGESQAVVTVFAPNNAAFAKIPAADLEALEADPAALSEVLRYHMVGGAQKANLVSIQRQMQTITSTTILVTVEGTSITLSDYLHTEAKVITTDRQAFNGILDVIDAVLTPPPTPLPDVTTALTDGGYTLLLEAIDAAGLTDAIEGGPFTIFAPTDLAISSVDTSSMAPEVLANILLYHLAVGTVASEDLLGESPLTSASNLPLEVTDAPLSVAGASLAASLDQVAANAVIHGINQVIIPPTIVGFLGDSPTLSDLSRAIVRIDWTEMLEPNTIEGDSPVTLFAPNDAAFLAASIDVDTVGTSTLTAVLEGHFLAIQVSGDGLTDGALFRTASGSVIEVRVVGEDTFITDEVGTEALVVEGDVRTLTGAVHVIDKVLTP